MAEALATVESKGRFVGYSAGSHPVGTVNPFAIEMIRPLGYPVAKLRSKHWEEFAAADAPQMDFVITVCDNAAGEVCHVWSGKPLTAHWGCQDPAAMSGSDDKKLQAFKDVFYGIQRRLKILLALPLDRLDRMSLQAELAHTPDVQRRVSRPVPPENTSATNPAV